MELPTGKTQTFDSTVRDLIIRLAVLAMLVYWSLNLISPFLPIFVWATVLAVALFPVHARLSALLGGRRGLAAIAITLLALLIVLGPVTALTVNLVETIKLLSAAALDGTLRVPTPPASVAEWPLVGEKVYAAWTLASTNLETAIRQLGPTLLPAGEKLVVMIAGVGADVLRFAFAVVLMGFLFVPGQKLAGSGRQFAMRIIAPRGAQFVDLAGATIRNVSRGVVGVAVLQTVLCGMVFQVADVPGAGLLAFLILIFCIIQIGPVLVIVPAIIWGWISMTTGAALIFTVILLAIGLLDNVLKPILMSRGLSTPTLVIFLGVIGGTITYGLIGLFLGPIILGVFYDLLVAWAQVDAEPNVASEPSE